MKVSDAFLLVELLVDGNSTEMIILYMGNGKFVVGILNNSPKI